MPPKKNDAKPAGKAKAKGKAKAAAVAMVPDAAVPLLDNSEGNACADHLMKVHEALQLIRDRPIFAGIDSAAPLSIAQGGKQSPFCLSDAVQALKAQGDTYEAAGNFMWQDHIWLANHRVPMNAGQIRAIQAFHLDPLKPPRSWPYELVLAVDKADRGCLDPPHGLQRLSPAEPCHALLFSVQTAIQQKAGDTTLKAWRNVLLTVSTTFELQPLGEERFWRAQNIREHQVQKGLVVQVSLRQRVFDVIGFATANNIWTASQVAKAYEKVKLADNAEPISASFVDSVLTVNRRTLSVEACRKLWEWCDQHFLTKNPFKSIWTLQGLIDRAKGPAEITFAMQGLIDGYRKGFVDVGMFAASKIKDPRTSYVEVLKLKMAAKDALLGEWLQAQDFGAEWKEKLRGAFRSFESARAKYAPYPVQGKSGEADTAWLVGCPESVRQTAEMLDDCLYSDTFDGRYRDAVKSKHEIGDFFAYASVKKRLDDVQALLRQESGPETKSNPASTTATGAGAAGSTSAAASAASAGSASAASAAVEKLSADEQEEWRQHILKILKSQVRLLPAENKTVSELEQSLKDCPFALLRGDPTGLVLIHFDVKKYGESTTRPDLRTPTLRTAWYNKLVRATLSARRVSQDSPATLSAGEVAVVLDGGKRGLRSKLLAPWKEGTNKEKAQKSKDGPGGGGEEDDDDEEEMEDETRNKPSFFSDILHLGYSQSSLSRRRQRIRGTATIKQIEWCHTMTSTRLALPVRDRKHYKGNSTGDLLEDIERPDLDKEWSMPWGQKKKLYGRKHLIEVGGKTENADDAGREPRTDAVLEPVCYHSMPAEFYDELVHMFYAKLVIDLCPSDGKLAFTAIKHRIGYVGITYNAEHAAFLEERLVHLIREQMTVPSSPLYNIQYSTAVGARAPEPAGTDKPKPKSKRGKRKKDATEEGQEAQDDDQDDEDDQGTTSKPKPAKPKKAPKKKAAKTEPVDLVEDDNEEEEAGADDDDLWDPLKDL
ncbi:unnamed protein product [Symbiodinium sp. KB8]|nr:unnamed protein product [Symbiodinium sp. KB8]